MKKNLLVCFDAFGTLFRPRQPIFKQYGDVARSHDLAGFTDEQVAICFKNAFKEESKAHPNYGKATNMGSVQWWTNVIEKTFKPLVKNDDKLPPGIAPALLHRFSSKDGYEIFPDAFNLLKRLSIKRVEQLAGRRIVVGIITNSDDRVPDILRSFGLNVRSLRHGGNPYGHSADHTPVDVDFAIMSYDVGFEKPDRRAFNAATDMLKTIMLAEGQSDFDLSQWKRLYVGDELEKDAEGAVNAGWDAVLVDRDGQYTHNDPHDQPHFAVIEDLASLDSEIGI